MHVCPDVERCEAQLATKLDAGMGGCVTQYLSTDHAVPTACMGGAKSLDQLAACDTDCPRRSPA